jgi:hypothetical protein
LTGQRNSDHGMKKVEYVRQENGHPRTTVVRPSTGDVVIQFLQAAFSMDLHIVHPRRILFAADDGEVDQLPGAFGTCQPTEGVIKSLDQP